MNINYQHDNYKILERIKDRDLQRQLLESVGVIFKKSHENFRLTLYFFYEVPEILDNLEAYNEVDKDFLKSLEPDIDYLFIKTIRDQRDAQIIGPLINKKWYGIY